MTVTVRCRRLEGEKGREVLKIRSGSNGDRDYDFFLLRGFMSITLNPSKKSLLPFDWTGTTLRKTLLRHIRRTRKTKTYMLTILISRSGHLWVLTVPLKISLCRCISLYKRQMRILKVVFILSFRPLTSHCYNQFINYEVSHKSLQ